MSRKDDIEAILRLLPTAPGEDRETARKNLEGESDEFLSEARTIFQDLADQNPSEKWANAQAKVRNLSGLQPLLEEWKALDNLAKLLLGR